MGTSIEKNRFSGKFINLAQPCLGAKITYVTDDFFAACDRMLNSKPATFIAGKFDEHGKWMDGWESRRKRTEGHDYAIVQLGKPGIVRGVDIDTSHFIGNHPPAASIDACFCQTGEPDKNTEWTEILGAVNLDQDSQHLHDIHDQNTYSHLRLNIYPDGGIARFRVYGEPQCDWQSVNPSNTIDLAALEYGGRTIACSDEAFGTSMLNLNLPGRSTDMGNGWETRRRRTPGNEWVIFALGHPGELSAVELYTDHYKGNYPDRASVQAGYIHEGTTESIITQSMFWPTLLPETKLEMDRLHRFDEELASLGPVTHVRVNIIPDGGLGRVRLFGNIKD